MRLLKLLLLCALLLASTCWAQAPNYGIAVTYRILNGATTPESMAGDTIGIGVLAFVKTDNGAIGKFEVCLTYIDPDAVTHQTCQTVSRRSGRGGYNPGPLPVLFSVPIQKIVIIETEGYTSAQVSQDVRGN